MPKLSNVFCLLLTAALVLVSSAALAHGPDANSQTDDARSNQQSNHASAAKRASPGKGKAPHAELTAYKSDEVLGWSLLVHEELHDDESLYKEVRDELHHQLFRIIKVVPAETVALLKKVPVWIELRNPYSGNCQYHPNKQWLIGNGYLGEKAKCVELSSAKGFLRSSQTSQPFVMLHELAHAYHDLHLGFDHEGIRACYDKAKASGSYDKVLHYSGRRVRAYAMVDHKEYFAEATEAYFGTNDHYPFVRAELKEHDPQMYEMVKKVWGKK